MTTAGDHADPRHGEWLTALGRATEAAASLATACFDIARVLGETPSDDMYHQDLGRLQGRVAATAKKMGPPPHELVAFLAALPDARETRNDLMHAFRVRDGLHRRVVDPFRIRDFFSIESLEEARANMEAASRLGNQALYYDGGASVRAWYQSGGP